MLLILDAIIVGVLLSVVGFLVKVLENFVFPHYALTFGQSVAVIVLLFVIKFGIDYVEAIFTQTFKKPE